MEELQLELRGALFDARESFLDGEYRSRKRGSNFFGLLLGVFVVIAR